MVWNAYGMLRGNFERKLIVSSVPRNAYQRLSEQLTCAQRPPPVYPSHVWKSSFFISMFPASDCMKYRRNARCSLTHSNVRRRRRVGRNGERWCVYKIVFIFYVSVHHKPHFRLIRLAGPIFFFRFLFSLAVRMCVPIACTYETYLYGISLRIRFVSLSSHLRLSLRPFIAMCECGQHGSRYILLRLYKALCVLHVRILTSALNGMFAQTFSAIRNNFFFSLSLFFAARWMLVDINIVSGDAFY